MIVRARRSAPRSQNYRRGVWSGLGLVSPTPPAYEVCDPRDSPCVDRNRLKGDAYQLAMQGARASNNYDDCMRQIPAQVANGSNEAGLKARCAEQLSIQTTPMPGDQPAVYSGSAPVTYVAPAQYAAPAAATPSTTPSGATIVNSSGAVLQPQKVAPPGGQPGPVITQPLLVDGGTPLSTGFDLSSIPVWGWAVAVGAALFLFGGQRGR